MKINGATRLYAIVGDPIAQVRSPEVFSERFAAAGINAICVPVQIPAAQFEPIFASLLQLGNLDGVFITVPFKVRAMPFAQHLGTSARVVGAVNALRREADGSWTADMFDGLGFVRGVERKGYRIAGRRVALFGAGGAGSAIACALAGAGVAAIDVIDTEAAKAGALVDRLRQHFPGPRFMAATLVAPGTDMIVNASPVGMREEDGLPGAIGSLGATTIIGDVVVRETPSPIVQLAIDRGYGWTVGKDMHGGQVDALLDFLAEASAPRS
jgi:shikimate dehydrogenase